MNIIPFEPDHLQTLALQDSQAWVMPMLSPEYGAMLKKAGLCFTAMEGEEIMACAGIMKIWEGRDLAWALISGNSGKHFIKIYRAIKLFIDTHPTRRIEATVDFNFAEGHRLMRMLGFEYEGKARAFMPDGRDVGLYARVK